jgi:hypothetical protein
VKTGALKGVKVRHVVRYGRRFSLVNFAGRIPPFGLALQGETGVSCVPMPSKRRAGGICDARRGKYHWRAVTLLCDTV